MNGISLHQFRSCVIPISDRCVSVALFYEVACVAGFFSICTRRDGCSVEIARTQVIVVCPYALDNIRTSFSIFWWKLLYVTGPKNDSPLGVAPHSMEQ